MDKWDLKVIVENGQWTTKTFDAEGPLDALQLSEAHLRGLMVQQGVTATRIELSRRD